MYDYGRRPAFAYIVKKARLIIERQYELRLLQNFSPGAIFGLKNMGWSDRMDMNLGGQEDGVPIKIDVSDVRDKIAKRIEGIASRAIEVPFTIVPNK